LCKSFISLCPLVCLIATVERRTYYLGHKYMDSWEQVHLLTRIVQKYMWKMCSIFCVYLGHLPQPASDMAQACRGTQSALECSSSKSFMQFIFSLSLMLLACVITNQSSRTRHFWLDSNQGCYPDSPWTSFLLAW